MKTKMNEPIKTGATLSNPASKTESKPLGSSTVIKISPISTVSGGATKAKLGAGKVGQTNENFAAAAKSLESVVDKLASVLSGASVKFCEIAAESIYEDKDKAAALAENVAISQSSRDALKTSGARILARRVDNEEIIDWAVVAAALGEIGVGWAIVGRELMLIRKMKQAQAVNLQPK